jgi:hypothetical protein
MGLARPNSKKMQIAVYTITYCYAHKALIFHLYSTFPQIPREAPDFLRKAR